MNQKLEHETLEKKSDRKVEVKIDKRWNCLHQKTRQQQKGAGKGKDRNKGKNNQISL